MEHTLTNIIQSQDGAEQSKTDKHFNMDVNVFSDGQNDE